MKKIINLLSFLFVSTFLSCTSELINEQINIATIIKPTAAPSPTNTIAPTNIIIVYPVQNYKVSQNISKVN